MLTALQKVKSAKRSISFLEFCKKEEKSIVNSLASIASCIPKEMYKNDNRMDIGRFVSNELARDFHALKEELSYGYDMLYNENRISVKFNKTNTFQRVGKNISLTKPKSIIIKNFHTVSEEREIYLDDFDYLLSISYKIIPQDLFFRGGVRIIYGVALVNTVQNCLVEESKSDHQLKAKIDNDAWDYCSGYKLKEVNVDERINRYNYKIADKLRWDLLRQINKGKGE